MKMLPSLLHASVHARFQALGTSFGSLPEDQIAIQSFGKALFVSNESLIEAGY
jgi:hypothetical protein